MDLNRWLRLHWDRVLAWALVGVGVIVLVVGWKRVADTPFPAEQIPYVVSAGIGGALCVIFGGALLLSADLRDEWTKLDQLERHLRAAPPEPEAIPTTNGTRPRRKAALEA